MDEQKSHRRKRALLAVSIALVLGGAAYVWMGLHRANSDNKVPSPIADSASAQRAIEQVKNDLEKINNSSLAPIKLGAHEIPQALSFRSDSDFQPRAHWFDAAERSSDGKFPASHTPLSFDASCKPYAESKYTTLETAIAREVEFDPTQATPADVQVQELAQFWQLGDTFYKLAGVWERDQPATYRVKLFAASSADFETNLRVMPLPDALAARTDLLSLGEAIDREVDRAIAAGGTRGARLSQVFYPSKSGEQTLEVKLHNGRATSWMFGHGRCQLREAGDAYCRCITPDSQEHQHTHDQQSAGPSKDAKEKPYRVHD